MYDEEGLNILGVSSASPTALKTLLHNAYTFCPAFSQPGFVCCTPHDMYRFINKVH